MSGVAGRLVGAALGAVVIVIGLPLPGSAEQTSNSDQPPSARKTAKPTAASKPASSSQRAAASRADQSQAKSSQFKPWSIEDALPSNSRAVRAPAPEAASPLSNIGRVPLRSGEGTFGFETETKFKANKLPDGRPVPAPQQDPEKASPYLGLSLSVPTGDNGISFPAPAAPPFGRPE